MGSGKNQTPRAEALYPRLVSLPLYPAMSEDQVVRVAETAKRIARAARKARVFPAGLGAASEKGLGGLA